MIGLEISKKRNEKLFLFFFLLKLICYEHKFKTIYIFVK